jgi:UDP-N-acetylmuramoylalanine--D-glutamate ligase
LENVLAAVTVAMIFGVKLAAIKKILKSFQGIPNRLELLREIGGVKYYNDTTSTTPEATFAGLKTLGKKKNIILIAGGTDKGLDFTELVKEINKTVKGLVLLKGTGTDRLKKYSIFNIKYFEVDSMADAVLTARKLAHHGDIILLSPACTSFGMFNNEFDRGNQFRNIVSKLK